MLSYLKILINHLLSYFKTKPNRIEIPLELDSQELIVRGIVHPNFYSNSKKQLKREAFLPPPNKSDVSTLRHKYTNDDFCKVHASKLKLGEYCGLSTFLVCHINEIVLKIPPEERIGVKVIASPIDENNKYISEKPVYTDSRGLPMHSDIIYDLPMIKGEPHTKHRKFAEELLSKSKYFEDPNVQCNFWTGKKLCWYP